jgi:tetratricopeptide (TPR) repeat protein
MKSSLIQWLFLFALVAVFVGWTIKHAEDPARRAFKWALTVPVILFMAFVVAPMVGQGGYGAAFGGIPMTAVGGLFLAFIWRHDIASLIARPFASLYDGGSTPPEPRPLYSTAQARQKQGHYVEAIAAVREQLAAFPEDFEGHMLLAQIQAENLQDLPGAELTVRNFCAQPGHPPGQMVFALYSLADWHLRYTRDREAARAALEEVIARLPETEFALSAAQRIAHLGTAEMLLSPEDRQKYVVPETSGNVGLTTRSADARVPAPAAREDTAAELVAHLQEHPLDMEARERLALIYIDQYARLDLAEDQLEQMIAQPHQPGRLIVRWLNLLADLQIRSGTDYDTVRGTLQRIVDREPDLAAAENARKRIALLRLEIKGKEQTSAVKLGSYEQDIGLKSRKK